MDIEKMISKNTYQDDLEKYLYKTINDKKSDPFSSEKEISRKIIINTIIQCTIVIIGVLRMMYLKQEKRSDNT